MAYITVNTATSHQNTLQSAFGALSRGVSAFVGALNRAVIYNSLAHQRFALVQRLQAKTDAELAAMNLRRVDIVHHAFGDLYYS